MALKPLKIEGFTGDVTRLPWGRTQTFCNYRCDGAKLCATLVIYKGNHDRVYTKGEVMAAIERRIDALPDTFGVADYQRIRDVLDFLDPA